jgi:hypothetical protein
MQPQCCNFLTGEVCSNTNLFWMFNLHLRILAVQKARLFRQCVFSTLETTRCRHRMTPPDVANRSGGDGGGDFFGGGIEGAQWGMDAFMGVR